MREIIKRQMELGEVDIGAIEISSKSRDDIPRLLRGLQHIYTTEEVRERVFEILAEVAVQRADGDGPVSTETGRPGMSQWQILVLGVLRLGLNADYDRIGELANQHRTVRQMLGHAEWTEASQWNVQTIKDNLRLFTPEILERINHVVVEAGHALVKKSPHEGLAVRCDSFVVETDVHFPTDINLLYDAVRKAAGLFDVGHMGVFEVTGPNAITFLDTVFSNYAAWIEDGQSMYGYVLEPDGSVIDDGIIYRVAGDHFYMIVNASNEDKDWDWLNAVNERRVVIDGDRPWVEVEAQATLRNLKDPAVGKNQKRDLALQGPASLGILQRLTDDPELRADLARVRRTELIECELAASWTESGRGIPLVIARTGYTGEEWGYEILVHPDDAATLWHAILEVGEPLGVKPCGLACRDSTRIEAGLPLYGHELAGHFDVSPIEAGFPGYVKYHKPFFVGRKALLAQEDGRERELIRFRVDEKGTRRPETGDPVVDRRGHEIGKVTSCSIDVEGYLVGLALVQKRYNVPETPIAIFPLRGKSLDEALLRGQRVALPIEATVLTRFPETGEARPSWMVGRTRHDEQTDCIHHPPHSRGRPGLGARGVHRAHLGGDASPTKARHPRGGGDLRWSPLSAQRRDRWAGDGRWGSAGHQSVRRWRRQHRLGRGRPAWYPRGAHPWRADRCHRRPRFHAAAHGCPPHPRGG